MKVAVIGPGTMGSGIAQAFAQVEGYEVVLVHYARLERSQQGIDGIVKGLQKRVDRGKMEQAEADAIAARLTPGLYEACADVDLIVESASEVMAVKKETFAKRHDCQAGMFVYHEHLFALNRELAKGFRPQRRYAFL